jgi:amino acid adenylation domain-containing protein
MVNRLPIHQERIRMKCVHPTGAFIEFEQEEVERSIPERFEQMVRRYPDRIAIKTTTHALNYDELNKRANRLARAILARRGEAKEAIALLIEDRSSMLAAILGVLKAGKFYVPVDPSYPGPRIAFVLNDSNAGLILSDNDNIALVDELGERRSDGLNIDKLASTFTNDNVGLSIAPETIAYIIYTSGSTGQPKGVVQNHRNVLHKIMAATNDFHISVDDRLSLLYSCSFSASVLPIFAALLNGAAVCPFDVQRVGPAGVAHWLRREAVSGYFSVPTLFRYFVEVLTEEEEVSSIRFVYLSGESVTRRDVELFRKHFPVHCILVHTLAIGETGTARQCFIDRETQIEGSAVPVGYEVPDKEVLLLDEHGEKVGNNQIGEIAIRSRYLAMGYWQRPDLTRSKFLPNPGSGDERTYLTGDLGFMLPDGCLYHLGRKDSQVKTRGLRVEVSETETALMNLDTVKEAAVLAKEDAAGNTRLVAYVVSSQPAPTVSALRRALAGQLPHYMIPSVFVLLEAMPLTPNGKIDRRALPDPQNLRPELETPFLSPRSPVETQLAEIWAQVLGLDQVGVHDNFFDLGGHSLSAAQVITRVIKHFQVELPLALLFQTPTVAEMALVILESQANKLDESQLNRILSDLEALSEEDARRALARAMKSSNKRSAVDEQSYESSH